MPGGKSGIRDPGSGIRGSRFDVRGSTFESRIANPESREVLPHSFYARPTLTVAEELLGKVLVHRTRQGIASGVIVEAEAYIGEDDPACHASFGRTARSEPLFGPAGFAYVYLNYGIHYLMNAVTEADGYPGAVLIRALQPLDGIELMKKRRAPDGRGIDEHDLCRGPGNLTKALGITIKDNRLDLTTSKLTIEDRGISVGTIATGPRIGIRVAVERPWRYWVEGHRSVSVHRSSSVKGAKMFSTTKAAKMFSTTKGAKITK